MNKVGFAKLCNKNKRGKRITTIGNKRVENLRLFHPKCPPSASCRAGRRRRKGPTWHLFFKKNLLVLRARARRIRRKKKLFGGVQNSYIRKEGPVASGGGDGVNMEPHLLA